MKENQKIICVCSESDNLIQKFQKDKMVTSYQWVLKNKTFISQYKSGEYAEVEVIFITDFESIRQLKESGIENNQMIVLVKEMDLHQMLFLQSEGLFNVSFQHSFELSELSYKINNLKLHREVENSNLKKHILIVDDISSNITLLKHYLSRGENYELHTAKNGIECLEKVASRDFDLLILDIQLPDIDGYTIAEFLKKSMLYKSIPIIFLTAFNKNASHVKKAIEDMGAVDYLYKPVDKAIIQAKVEGYLSLSTYRSTLEKNHHTLLAQKKVIDEVNTSMIDNINYARRIQRAILPQKNLLKKVFKNQYLHYEPKDILSGDLYYVYEFSDKLIWAIGDCTGHGVSGALLSMTVSTLLHKNVIEQSTNAPHDVLKALHIDLLDAFENLEEDTQDGVELGLVIYDKTSNKLSYSGANIALWVIDSKNSSLGESLNERVSRVGANKIVLGQSIYDYKALKSYEIINASSQKYMMQTDGLVDQLGGEKEERFKRSRLMKCFDGTNDTEALGNCILEKFEQWKGNSPQTDDVSFLITEV